MISLLVPLQLANVDEFLERREITTSNAHQPNRVQWVIYLDYDEARAVLRRMPESNRDIIVIGPRFGYKKLHRYYNKLAAVSGGDWLMLFGDDCIITTEGWDTLIMRQGHPEVPQYLIGTNSENQNPCFPVISRGAYNALGCFSKHWANDTWLAKVFEALAPEHRYTIPFHVINESVRRDLQLDPEFWVKLRDFVHDFKPCLSVGDEDE